MEHGIVVKSEMEVNGELLVLYVDENGAIDEANLEQLQQGNFIIEDISQSSNEIEDPLQADEQNTGRWTDDETRRLLVFYIDNRETFLNGATKKKHLWAVACKTMLPGKNPTSCEMKLRNLKKSYTMVRVDQSKGKLFVWPYYDLCHQAFHDDSYVNLLVNDAVRQQTETVVNIPMESIQEENVVVVKPNPPTKPADERVEHMLNLYLNYKKTTKDFRQKQIWEQIAFELGEDADYWHKRFFNFKQHYIRMLDKRRESGPQSINWPYMNIFDQIFEDDQDFQRKFGNAYTQQPAVTVISNEILNPAPLEWDDTEKTVLVKYCFDCIEDFYDPLIPKTFLWNEIGRLLDKKADECKKKYEELKQMHLDQYINGSYNMRSRVPISILFDNIICKEDGLKVAKSSKDQLTVFTVEDVDTLVQYFYDNMDMFKDPICHFVCWASISKKLNKPLQDCKNQWSDLTGLYKTILHEKKEDHEMEVDWRYIELFDRIFDYGMDTKLLDGYEAQAPIQDVKVDDKKLITKLKEENEDEDDKEIKGRTSGDSKQFQILEYYLKNKDRFAAAKKRKQQALWETLAKQIKITAEQCAHRFRNLKQVYISYIEREIARPEMPILWPYYNLCKKVFGYRLLKNKLKNTKLESTPIVEWSTKEIKQVVNFFSRNFESINKDAGDTNLWIPLARDMGKTATCVKDMFLELCKAYRKVKTMMNRNPNCKITWKYFKLFEMVYQGKKLEEMEGGSDADAAGSAEIMEDGDEEYQCIIVMPENEEANENSTQVKLELVSEDMDIDSNIETKIIVTEKPQVKKSIWKNKDKKILMQNVLNYLKTNQGKLIQNKDMWKEVAETVPNKTAISCKRMYIKLKTEYKQKVKDPDYQKTVTFKLFKEIFATKPKFYRPAMEVIQTELNLEDSQTLVDVNLPELSVEQALRYYLEHLEEFINPMYSKQYMWKELGNQLQLSGVKLFKKIHYLKNSFEKDTGESAGEKVVFADILKEIIEKENVLKVAFSSEPTPDPNPTDEECTWTDEEVDLLLVWYLENLDKFKNPKYVTTYLWMEAPKVLKKSAVACSKKMAEIRNQYSAMVKKNPEALTDWRFSEMCQKIYGTGKKNSKVIEDKQQSEELLLNKMDTL